ncbi:amidohydrolase [Actinomadura parmotrematis]|uniref:Amidohydrolase n=1 Tax=Actinomadura parmotrematis TaxID=2864039 RepID=A0ABS7G4S0_9ACTN|nr:amidohydrolase [Actinomadura parmotrematis]MBW8487699.1 amidohydrolase [Actinomadura parmotrematis]
MRHDQPADLVFHGGPVHTVDAARSRATAVAVTGERVTAVGHDEVRALVGPRTEVVDLRGRLLIPGFQDAHVHPVGGGVELGQCDLTGRVTAAEYAAAVRAYADRHDGPWITGGGWSMEAFPGGTPDRRALDAIVPDRPVYLVNRDHHGAWANSRALELAGVTAATPDPADGRIERDAGGEPTGMLQEGAMGLVARFVPPPTERELLDGLLRAQALLHSYGVTAWQDAIIGNHATIADPSTAYAAAARDGLLTARVRGALWWDRGRGLEQLDGLRERRDALTTGRDLNCHTVKIMQDGIAENGTAAMLAPYLTACGCASDNSGISFVEPDALKEYVTALDREGFQVHFHALGDRAVREALDAVEAARRANGWTDTRPHLAHLQVVAPADVPRFAALGAAANVQALWAAHEPQMDDLTIPFLGAERAAQQYPFGDLLRAGATLAAGSDWPVSSADPIAALHTAVNRHEPGSDRPVFLPEQRLDLGAALAAYTAGSAYVNHLDGTGSIVPGHLADLAVLDRDPFAGPPAEIHRTRVLQTFVGGRRVYAADDA